jgi:hypothetical protein
MAGQTKAVKDKRREAYLAAIARGLSRTLASRASGVCRTTAHEWMADPEWAARVDEAEIRHIDKHLGIVTDAAENGEWQASKWLLSVRHRDEFGTQRVEVTGKDGGPVVVDMRPAAALTDAEIAAELAAIGNRPDAS